MIIRYLSVSDFSAMKANALQTMAMCNAFAARAETHLYFFDVDGCQEKTLRSAFVLHPDLHLRPVRKIQLPVASGLFNLLRMAAEASRDGGSAGFIYTREIFLALFLTLFGPPFFLEHHLDLRESWHRALLGLITRCRRFIAHIPISSSLVPSIGLDRLRPIKVMVLHDGVDLSLFGRPLDRDATRKSLSLPEDGFLVGYAGQLFREKGAWFLLDLAELMPGTRFLLVGGEPKDLEAMRQETAARALGNVILAGRVPQREVPAYLAACDCFILPNTVNYYMSPLKLFEYMASNRPVLASDFPPFREIIESGKDGILVPAGNLGAFRTALDRLAGDSGLREALAKSACAKVEKDFTWHARVEQILAALDRGSNPRKSLN